MTRHWLTHLPTDPSPVAPSTNSRELSLSQASDHEKTVLTDLVRSVFMHMRTSSVGTDKDAVASATRGVPMRVVCCCVEMVSVMPLMQVYEQHTWSLQFLSKRTEDSFHDYNDRQIQVASFRHSWLHSCAVQNRVNNGLNSPHVQIAALGVFGARSLPAALLR